MNYYKKSTIVSALVLAFILIFTVPTFADGNVYKKGERSKDIAKIQQALKDQKLFSEEVTGYFGEVTEEAVKKFQKIHKLEADGVVGPGTLKALFGKTSISGTTVSRATVERKKVNITYTIEEGDTIWDIADDFNVSFESILKYNNLTEDTVLKIGQKITIPNVVREVVKVPAPAPEKKVVVASEPTKEAVPTPKAAETTQPNAAESVTDLPDDVYITKEGDTLQSVAEDYGVTAKALAEFNGLAEDAELKEGQELKIPEAAEHTEPVVTEDQKPSTVQKGEYLSWFNEVQYIFEKNEVAVVTDLKTGKSFSVKRLYGRNHADVEPLTKEDTAIMKSIYGSWSWDRRAVLVTIDGKTIAGSMNGMPHGGEQIKDNGFAGHFCIHFKGSKTHKGNRMDASHQAAVKLAAGIK